MSELIKGVPLKAIPYSDKPLPQKGKIVSLTPTQLREKCGFEYTESIWSATDESYVSDTEAKKVIAGYESDSDPFLPSRAAIGERLKNPLDCLVVCKDAKEKHGLYTTQDIASGTVIGIYAGDIQNMDVGNSGTDYSFAIIPCSTAKKNVAVDASRTGNLMRFINDRPIDKEYEKKCLKKKIKDKFIADKLAEKIKFHKTTGRVFVAEQYDATPTHQRGSETRDEVIQYQLDMIWKDGVADRDAEINKAWQQRKKTEYESIDAFWKASYSPLDKVEFKPEIKSQLAIANVVARPCIINGVPVIVIYTPNGIKANEELGVCYGPGHWQTRSDYEFVKKDGSVVPQSEYPSKSEPSKKSAGDEEKNEEVYLRGGVKVLCDNGVQKLTAKQYADAIKDLDAAIKKQAELIRLKKDPEDEKFMATIHSNLGSAYRDNKQLEKAEEHFQAAFDIRVRVLPKGHADIEKIKDKLAKVRLLKLSIGTATSASAQSQSLKLIV